MLTLQGVLRQLLTVVVLGTLPALPAHAQSLAAAGTGAAPRLVKAPPGFTRSCARYSWLCSDQNSATARISGSRLIDLARAVNNRVNRDVAPLTDPENYGVAEYWTLPNNGNGDCEDYALEKYRLLLQAGVDSRNLRLAMALNRNRDNHLVLVLRHETGDLVLDNLTSQIMPWNETGYSFLAMQYGAEKSLWEVVMNRDRRQAMLAER